MNRFKTFLALSTVGLLLFSEYCQSQEVPAAEKVRFQNLLQTSWNEVFFDSGKKNWQKRWFLDGERAKVKNTPSGMVFTAGPVEGDNGSHAVLWTNQSFEGDVKIEFDYTRLDDIDKAVNILYIQATGVGTPPYAKDIAEWSNLREVPYMRDYFLYMNLLHISYAAYTLHEANNKKDYVRARRYPVKPGEKFTTSTALSPDYEETGLFEPGKIYHFTVIKNGSDLFMEVKNDETSKLFYWNTSPFPPVIEGHIGIRHMWTRCSRYADFRVSVMR